MTTKELSTTGSELDRMTDLFRKPDYLTTSDYLARFMPTCAHVERYMGKAVRSRQGGQVYLCQPQKRGSLVATSHLKVG